MKTLIFISLKTKENSYSPAFTRESEHKYLRQNHFRNFIASKTEKVESIFAKFQIGS